MKNSNANANSTDDTNSEGEKYTWNEILDNSSTRSTLDNHNNEKRFIKLPSSSVSYVFPLIYFFTSSVFLFVILFLNVYKDKMLRHSLQALPLHPLPGFFTLKEVQPQIHAASILIISISGFLNVWFFCSLLLQRFSVPELKSNKKTVHLMFILGIFGNLIYIFFGFSPELLRIEADKLKVIKVSLSMIIFLSFVFFNLFFASLSLLVFHNFKVKIATADKRLNRNIKCKKYVLYMALFILSLYVAAITTEYNFKKEIQLIPTLKDILNAALFTIPYIVYVLNALINLSYYLDIIYLEDTINMIVDREYFMTEDSDRLIAHFPLDI